MKKFLIIGFFAVMCIGSISVIKKSNIDCLIAGRGCCSHHGGVCGCKGGRSLCCDGTLSPSCNCLKDEIKLDL